MQLSTNDPSVQIVQLIGRKGEALIPPNDSFFVSVIIPIFNTEKYLEESIRSVINQTLGFERHIQLILVNDGSTDNSSAICRKYQEIYPENIVYIEQVNKGVSSARNKGLEKATGTYVNFLDSDDKWSIDAFESFRLFLISHPEIHIATAKHIFFGRKASKHPLAYKYDSDREIDILTDYSYPHLSLSNAVILKDLFKTNPFNDALEISEDFYVFNDIILSDHCYAVLCKPVYWYRKREDSSSAIDSSIKNISWYTKTPTYCYKALFDLSKSIYGFVIPYIQFCIMYDLQWRIKNPANHPLDSEQYTDYKANIVDLLSEIDDEIILEQRNLNRADKVYVLSLKYGISADDILQDVEEESASIVWRKPNGTSLVLWSAHECNEVLIDFVEKEGRGLIIEGRLPYPLPFHLVSLFAVERNSSLHRASLSCCPDKYQSGFFDKEYYHQILFKVHVPIDSFEIKLSIGSCRIPPNLKFGKFCPLSWSRFSYKKIDNFMLTTKRPGKIIIKNCPPLRMEMQELKYQIAQWIRHPQARPLLKFRRSANAYWKSNPNRQIWLISDRIIMAGDNGEALFSYLQQNPIENVDTYFVISRDSIDFERMQAIGPVLAYGSDQHKLMTLCANAIISSAGEDEAFNAFGKMRYLFKSIVQYKYVFLQHGVTKDDISSWLNRRNKNIRLFITAAFREYQSIRNNPRYGYDESVLALTGFPRHDKLLSDVSKNPTNLLIAPTWRQELAPDYLYDRQTGVHEPNPNFIKSTYFRFYNALINDERIENAAKRSNTQVRFLIHPALIQEIPKFDSNFCIIESEYNYADEFANAKILVTDYSSVAFDFALLKQPVVYAQFDEDDFFSNHLYSKGYFDYRNDGFGAVCKTYEACVEHILDYLVNPIMEPEYAERVDKFFLWPKEQRCKLVTDKVKKLLE